MSLAGQTSTRSPRWDRTRVLFEIEMGGRCIECAISREALQDASDRRYGKPLELLACFSKVRTRIERIALAKYMARSDTIEGLVTIWSSDLDDPLPRADVAKTE
jgi:Protein of unknown function (DUF1488)